MHGTFIWHELMTPDPAAAKAFYSALLGWEPTDMQMEGFTYTTFAIKGFPSGVTGMMALSDEMREQGIPPNWTGYIKVDDVDKTAAEFERDGGAIHRAPEDIPGIGRFAVVADTATRHDEQRNALHPRRQLAVGARQSRLEEGQHLLRRLHEVHGRTDHHELALAGAVRIDPQSQAAIDGLGRIRDLGIAASDREPQHGGALA